MSEFIEKSRSLPPEMIKRFKLAVETGKWPDGSEVTASQREIALQAVIAYESEHMDASQRTAAMDGECASKNKEASGGSEQPIKLPDAGSTTKH